MPKQEELTEQEWSHFFDIDDLEKDKTKISIEASEEERTDMARRLNVLEIKNAKADLILERPSGRHAIYVTGKFKADIVQECAVTLEPIDVALSEEVEGWFAEKEKAVSFAAAKRERDMIHSSSEVEIIDESEDPEPVVDGVIDLGELVTQHISLAIPPYPRIEGARHEFGDEDVNLDDKSPLRKNPFEALKDWKENR